MLILSWVEFEESYVPLFLRHDFNCYPRAGQVWNLCEGCGRAEDEVVSCLCPRRSREYGHPLGNPVTPK
jgi:hypothetical protein